MPRLMFVHPHPDDETLACGGAIATHVAAGDDVTVVTCTGGEAGDNLAEIDLGGRDMPQVRRDEMAAAIEALGSPDHLWLGYRDSGMVDTPANDHPDSFHRAELDVAAERLAEMIRQRRPHAIVADNAEGTYGHPDHIKAHHVTARAVQLAAKPSDGADGWQVPRRFSFTVPRSRIWRMHQWLLDNIGESRWGDEDMAGPEDLPFGEGDDVIDVRLDVADAYGAKLAAMRAHASQIPADSSFFLVPPGAVDGWGTVEYFTHLDGEPNLGDRLVESDRSD